jgi:hypothetical protein
MKKILSCLMLLTAFSFGFVACKSEKAANQSESNKLTETKPVKVLIYHSNKSDCAADGDIFLANIYVTQAEWEVEKPDLVKGLSLESTNRFTVIEESVDNANDSKKEKEKEKSETPKSNPKDFDFLIRHTVDYKEHKKKSLNDPLKITAKETWTVEKVSDPSVKVTQTATYILDAGSDLDAMEKITEEQITKVIIPSLAPLLKEIRAFIENNSKK